MGLPAASPRHGPSTRRHEGPCPISHCCNARSTARAPFSLNVRLCLWYFALLGGGGADEGNSAGRAREGSSLPSSAAQKTSKMTVETSTFFPHAEGQDRWISGASHAAPARGLCSSPAPFLHLRWKVVDVICDARPRGPDGLVEGELWREQRLVTLLAISPLALRPLPRPAGDDSR